jgi:hypothetical protein
MRIKNLSILFLVFVFAEKVSSASSVDHSSIVSLGVGYESGEYSSNISSELFYRYKMINISSKILVQKEQFAADFFNLGLSLPISDSRNSSLMLNTQAGVSFLSLTKTHNYVHNYRTYEYDYDPILNFTSMIELRWDFEAWGVGVGYRQRFAPKFLKSYEDDENNIIHKPNKSNNDNRNYVDHANYMLDKLTGWYVNFHFAFNFYDNGGEENAIKQKSNYGRNNLAVKKKKKPAKKVVKKSINDLAIEILPTKDVYAGESTSIKIRVKNTSAKEIKKVYLDVKNLDNYIKGIEDQVMLGDLNPYSAKVIEIPIQTKKISETKVSEDIVFYAKAPGYKSNTKLTSLSILRNTLPDDIKNLEIKNFAFIDDNDNELLDSKENAILKINIKNKANKPINRVRFSIDSKNKSNYIEFEKHEFIGRFKPNETKSFFVNLNSKEIVDNSKIEFTLKANGEELNSDLLTIKTQKTYYPELVFSQVNFSDKMSNTSSGNGNNQIESMETIEANLLVENIGQASTNNTTVNIEIGDRNIVYLPENWEFKLGSLNVNEKKLVNFSFLVNNRYRGTDKLPIYARIKEDGKTQIREHLNLNLNKRAGFAAVTNNNVGISDVDIDIPRTNQNRENTFALIIGNEDYASYQLSDKSDVNVDFAINDADIFKKYAVNTLGIPEKNITFIKNATVGKMNQAVDKIKKLNKISDDSKVLFYYAGHGLSHEATKEPYLMPVDINPGNIEHAIKLESICNNLADGNPQRVTVVLDACFSGATRDKSLTNYRGAIVRPKDDFIVNENVIILSSSSDIQTSGIYKEQKHGMFTYYLLKKLKETKGDVSFADLIKYLKKEVQKNSLLINNKEQTPELKYGRGVIEKEKL